MTINPRENYMPEVLASPEVVRRLGEIILTKIEINGMVNEPKEGGRDFWYIEGNDQIVQSVHLATRHPKSTYQIRDSYTKRPVEAAIASVNIVTEPSDESLSESRLWYPVEMEEIWILKREDRLSAQRRLIVHDRLNPKVLARFDADEKQKLEEMEFMRINSWQAKTQASHKIEELTAEKAKELIELIEKELPG